MLNKYIFNRPPLLRLLIDLLLPLLQPLPLLQLLPPLPLLPLLPLLPRVAHRRIDRTVHLPLAGSSPPSSRGLFI